MIDDDVDGRPITGDPATHLYRLVNMLSRDGDAVAEPVAEEMAVPDQPGIATGVIRADGGSLHRGAVTDLDSQDGVSTRDVHRLLANPGGVPLLDWEARWPRLLSAIVGGAESPVTLDFAEPLVDLRGTVTRVINDLVAGVGPSIADWRELIDEFCVAHLLWCINQRALSDTSRQHPV
jgi:hypothetical protein